jgi:hypothetical protein
VVRLERENVDLFVNLLKICLRQNVARGNHVRVM